MRHGRWHYCPGSSPRSRRKRGTQNQAIGKSIGGMITKILALTDESGQLVRFSLMPGQRGETTGVAALIDSLSFGAVLDDKAYDADWLRDILRERGIEVVIPARAKRLNPAPHDADKYKLLHFIENFFQKLKEFKRIATRTCKTDQRFTAMIQIAATVIRTR
ncbi:IS5 family transposase [Insolitispirillum peregrinum]